MKKSFSYERKIAYLLLHQLFILLMVVCFFIYEYQLLSGFKNYLLIYLIASCVFLIGGVTFLLFATRAELRLYKRRRKKSLIDKVYPEVIIGIVIILLLLFGKIISTIRIADYTMAGLIIITDCITYIMDTIFLIGYFNIAHRIIGKRLKIESLSFVVWSLWKERKTGKSLKDISRKAKEQEKIRNALELIAIGQLDTTLEMSEFHGPELEMASYINRIQEGLKETVDKRIKDEKMKADLITNVSHDIKTPLTSIVNYVELLKREELNNENAKNYIRIIDEKSQRLKQLTEDLVEISKISSGNIHLDIQTIDFLELLYQTAGEFNERFENRNLTIITKLPPTSVHIKADGRQLYRALENLYANAAKYAMENTTIYVELMRLDKIAVFIIKNIIDTNLQVTKNSYEDLTERFVRGEVSRTTEGSGLGLSIAKSLTTLMGGTFHILVDKDTFAARITFPLANDN